MLWCSYLISTVKTDGVIVSSGKTSLTLPLIPKTPPLSTQPSIKIPESHFTNLPLLIYHNTTLPYIDPTPSYTDLSIPSLLQWWIWFYLLSMEGMKTPLTDGEMALSDHDELSNQLSYLHCDDPTIVLPDEEDTIDENESKFFDDDLTLIGKVIADKLLDHRAIIGSMRRAWYFLSKCVMQPLQHNQVSFTMESEKDVKMVLDKGPWLVDDNVLVLKKWIKETPPSEMMFNTSPFWIRAYNIPYNRMTTATGKLVGAIAGEFVEVDLQRTRDSQFKYLRIKVLVDVTKALATGCLIEMKGRPAIQVELQYERLPIICFICGKMGHNYHFCAKFSEEVPIHLRREERRKRVDNSKYGRWLKAESDKAEKERLKADFHSDRRTLLSNRSIPSESNRREDREKQAMENVSSQNLSSDKTDKEEKSDGTSKLGLNLQYPLQIKDTMELETSQRKVGMLRESQLEPDGTAQKNRGVGLEGSTKEPTWDKGGESQWFNDKSTTRSLGWEEGTSTKLGPCTLTTHTEDTKVSVPPPAGPGVLSPNVGDHPIQPSGPPKSEVVTKPKTYKSRNQSDSSLPPSQIQTLSNSTTFTPQTLTPSSLPEDTNGELLSMMEPQEGEQGCRKRTISSSSLVQVQKVSSVEAVKKLKLSPSKKDCAGRS